MKLATIKSFFALILALPLLSCVQDIGWSQDEIVQDEKNSNWAQEQQYVLLISIDGFRYDYAKRFGAENLLSLQVHADRMIPSFPTKTFPNHYTIATGLYPGSHGLVSNSFYAPDLGITYRTRDRTAVQNGDFYAGTPLWVLASHQSMLSASYFWVGSEADVRNIRPTYYYNYNGKVPNSERVHRVFEWFSFKPEKRPHIVTLYFSDIDDAGHRYGPDSEELKLAVLEMDALVGTILNERKKLNIPLNIIIVSDHGMAELESEPINIDQLVDLSELNVSRSFPIMVYSEDSEKLNTIYRELQNHKDKLSVYKKDSMPAHYHFSRNSPRVGDLLIQPNPNFDFGSKTIPSGRSTHGFDPTESDEMGAIFYADGPAFNSAKIKAFENIHVYPLIANILGLSYDSTAIDGSAKVLAPILKK